MNLRQAKLIRSALAFLLDFDGPVCSAFAGYPAPQVAADLTTRAMERGAYISPEQKDEQDPMEVLRLLYEAEPRNYEKAESFLTAAEVRSVEDASPTSGSVAFMKAAQKKGIPVVIVSNNSPESVRSFLLKQGLTNLVWDVIGRTKNTPELMKPHPYLLNMGLRSVGRPAEDTPMIGDSITDLRAAQAVDCPAIGFANRDDKSKLFEEEGAEIVVTDMRELAEVLAQDRF